MGDGVVPLRLKLEKSSTTISVVEESSFTLVEDEVVVETVVNVVTGAVVVVVVVVVEEVVVDVIRILGCCRITVRSPPLPVTSGRLSNTSLLRKFESSLTTFEDGGRRFSSCNGF
jgi:hypothetical protein